MQVPNPPKPCASFPAARLWEGIVTSFAAAVFMPRQQHPTLSRLISCLHHCSVAYPVQAHAAVVSGFVKNGFAEHQKAHVVPAAAKAGLTLNKK